MAYTVKQFILDDLPQTLFPLKSDKVLVRVGFDELLSFAKKTAFDPAVPRSFLPQTRVSAMKKGWHLRRTLKLDPVSEVFVYDLVYRNRKIFRKHHSRYRKHFGFRFEDGTPLSPATSFREFRKEVSKRLDKFDHNATFDVSSYFNNIYHHDLVGWLDERDGDERDVQAFGKFLREINSGRSTDFFPQGIYPCKMIGSDFLSFVENFGPLRCKHMLRFMDDFYIFSDKKDDVLHDLIQIQELLGLKGLSINSQKTRIDQKSPSEPNEMKSKLLDIRRDILFASGLSEGDERAIETEIDDQDIAYLKSMLAAEHIEEEDAELVLSVMRDHAEDISEYLAPLLKDFPNLSKSFFFFAEHIEDREFLAKLLLDHLKFDYIPEYQLFWIAAIAEEYLSETKRFGDILMCLLHHRAATPISKSKVLEIPDKRFGLSECREEILRSGQSDWLAWASAVGSRNMKSKSRNYLLGYFKNGSDMNRLIGDIVSTL